MPSYHVERSIVIDKPIKEVRDTLKNFKEWPRWSPWIVMEPDATLTYSDRQGQVGATYGWAGVLIGAGSMELMEVRDDELKMELNFVKPFKSRALVGFRLEADDDTTKVTWYMDGKLPFFMFWMTGKMKTLIGFDYARGLQMLKEYLQTGNVASFVHIEGVLPLEEQEYIGIPRCCSIDELGVVMKQDFEALYTYMRENNISQNRVPFSIYNSFDIHHGTTEYVACIPLKEHMEIKNTWTRGKLEKHNTLKTLHKGHYMHLGNGWMTAINFARMKKMKTEKSPVGYEFYLNNPYEITSEDLLTEIYIPLR